MRKTLPLALIFLVLAIVLLAKFRSHPPASTVNVSPTVTTTPTATPTLISTAVIIPSPENTPGYGAVIPNFDHIVLIVLENEYLQNVIASPLMPNFNALAKQNVLLSNYSGITHPSLPNYLAMISGSSQDITNDCTNCTVNAPNLMDEIEASGRTWKAYFEDMPSPCFVGSRKPYEQIFDPFIYFDSIRLDPARCTQSLVPLTQLDADMKSGQLPNFIYIAPNVCHSGHDCSASVVDKWLGGMVAELKGSSALGQNSLLIITFDEGVQQSVAVSTHGEVATLLISSLARSGYVDTTPYSHYSLLKTILYSWNLKGLGETLQASVTPILNPWTQEVGSIYPRELTPNP